MRLIKEDGIVASEWTYEGRLSRLLHHQLDKHNLSRDNLLLFLAQSHLQIVETGQTMIHGARTPMEVVVERQIGECKIHGRAKTTGAREVHGNALLFAQQRQ